MGGTTKREFRGRNVRAVRMAAAAIPPKDVLAGDVLGAAGRRSAVKYKVPAEVSQTDDGEQAQYIERQRRSGGGIRTPVDNESAGQKDHEETREDQLYLDRQKPASRKEVPPVGYPEKRRDKGRNESDNRAVSGGPP